MGALSTATSGLSAMDTDGSGDLAAAAAALASQEELEAAAAARQARREQRRAQKELRRQEMLQVRVVGLAGMLCRSWLSGRARVVLHQG